MKKTIRVPFQKKILYVPVLNGLILFFWIYNSLIIRPARNLFLKSILFAVGRAVFASAPLLLLSYFINPLTWFFTAYTVAGVYFVLYFVGSGLIEYQEEAGL